MDRRGIHSWANDGARLGHPRLGETPWLRDPVASHSTRHGDTLAHVRIVSRTQVVDLSAWQVLVQEFGILKRSVIDGGMNSNVWLRTFTSAIVCSIFGM